MKHQTSFLSKVATVSVTSYLTASIFIALFLGFAIGYANGCKKNNAELIESKKNVEIMMNKLAEATLVLNELTNLLEEKSDKRKTEEENVGIIPRARQSNSIDNDELFLMADNPRRFKSTYFRCILRYVGTERLILNPLPLNYSTAYNKFVFCAHSKDLKRMVRIHLNLTQVDRGPNLEFGDEVIVYFKSVEGRIETGNYAQKIERPKQ